MPDISKWTSGLFIPQRRTIGGIHAQVTIRETERDELQITEHPVEQGAPIADHAFKRPSEVQIRAGWSAGGSGNLSANGGVYHQLLAWQASLNPFDIHTGKRSYKNMLIQSLTVTTDNESEFALMADIVCKQVIIVATKTGTVSKAPDNPDNMKDPASNGGSTEKGNQQTRSLKLNQDASNVSGESADLVGTRVTGDGEAMAPSGEQTLRGSGAESGPEEAKVDRTIWKNDPTGEIQAEKGVSTPLKPGQTMVVPIPPPPPTRTVYKRLRNRQPPSMMQRLRYIGR